MLDNILIFKFIENIISKYFSLFFFIFKLRNYKIKKNILDKNGIYILGTAPSIKNYDLSKLNDKDIFLCNKGYLLNKYGLDINKVKYYILIDSRLYKEDKYEIEKNTKNIKYRFWGNYFYKKKYNNDYFLKTIGRLYNYKKYNYFNPNIGLYETDTVVFSAIQIAEYLGYKNIYLLGVDFIFDEGKKYFYKGKDNGRDNLNTFPYEKIISDFSKINYKLNKKGINIYIGNKDSILTKICKYKKDIIS